MNALQSMRIWRCALWAGLVCGFSVLPLRAEMETAEELAARGFDAYKAADYAAAAGAFSRFITSYGDNAEVADALGKMLPLLAFSQVQLKRFDEALLTIDRALERSGDTPADVVEELRFWKAVCELQAANYAASRESMERFLKRHPGSSKRAEVMILLGTTLSIEGKHKEAAGYFATMRDQLKGFDRGRAVVLELNSLIEAGQLDAAHQLLLEEYPRMDEILQLVSFQTLALELGSRLLEQKRHREAISCLQRVWRQKRLLRHQEKRLAEVHDQLTAATQRRADPYLRLKLAQIVAKLERERKNFRAVSQFDAALRLRLALAFQGMARYREAALVMEEMLHEMEAGEVVEEASVDLVRCWMEIARWPKAIEAANDFRDRFPKSASLPVVAFMKGQSQEEARQFTDAVETFAGVAKSFPSSEFAPRALFMAGYSELQMENYDPAIAFFDRIAGEYPKDPTVETALFWKGMALSFSKEYAAARAIFGSYLKTYGKKARYTGATRFQHAYCAQGLRDYETSIPELRAFLSDFPGDDRSSEALVLLADALMAQGRIDDGIAALKRVPAEDTRFYEEAWFKIGKALKAQEKVGELRKHMEKFVRDRPRSPRVAEAVYWIGWTWRQGGDEAKALAIYWKTIDELGNDPASRGVEDLFMALPKLYRGEKDRLTLSQKLSLLTERADEEDKETLAVRALWANGRLMTGADATRSGFYFLAAAGRIRPESANPILMADVADGLRRAGKLHEAARLYLDLVKWNPRAVQKDRAFAGLGLIAMANERTEEAFGYFERFEKQMAGSGMFGEIMLARAQLLREGGQVEGALRTLEKLLARDDAKSAEKVRALYGIGDILMDAGKSAQAVAYFQRIYVMYGRWPGFVAKAYLRSGEAFEKLDDRPSAIRTYRELLQRPELAPFSETEEARRRLEQLEVPS